MDRKIGEVCVVRIRERERFIPMLGWDKEYLFYTDGSAWTVGEEETAEPERQKPPRGFVWMHGVDWSISDWGYGFNVTDTTWKSERMPHHFVRVRFWTREAVFDPVAFLAGTEGALRRRKRRRERLLSRSIGRTNALRTRDGCWDLASRGKICCPPTRCTTVPRWPRVDPVEREPKLSAGWQWSSDWQVKLTGQPCGDDGWSYSWNFGAPNYGPKCLANHFVRRRLWTRGLVFHPPPEMVMQDAGEKVSTTEKNLALITSNLLSEIAFGQIEVESGRRARQAGGNGQRHTSGAQL